MAATTTGFIFFSKFKSYIGRGLVDLSQASHFRAELHHSGAAALSGDAQVSTIGSITGTTSGIVGSASRSVANVSWSTLSAAPSSQFSWDSDAIIWTASATATVKFAVFYMSALAADSVLPIGFIQLVAADQEVTAGNKVTLTPNTYWFRMSG